MVNDRHQRNFIHIVHSNARLVKLAVSYNSIENYGRDNIYNIVDYVGYLTRLCYFTRPTYIIVYV